MSILSRIGKLEHSSKIETDPIMILQFPDQTEADAIAFHDAKFPSRDHTRGVFFVRIVGASLAGIHEEVPQ